MNRKKTKDNQKKLKAKIVKLAASALPNHSLEFTGQCGHSVKIGRVFGFRVRDERGKYCSNIIWIDPNYEGDITESWLLSSIK